MQFYESESFLCDQVAEFLTGGLSIGEGAVVIATEPHRTALIERLTARGFDVDAAVRDERFALLDAADILRTFMEGDEPDPERFNTVLGPVIDLVRENSPARRVRAYGEMVDLLWQSGKVQAASRLEDLWSSLAALHSFDLLCAYTMAGAYNQPSASTIARICKQHDAVGPFELAEGTNPVGASFAEVQALRTEIARHRVVEAELRADIQLLKTTSERMAGRIDELAKELHSASLKS